MHSGLGERLIVRSLLGLELPQIRRQVPDDAAVGMVRMAFDLRADVGHGGPAAQHEFGYKLFCKRTNDYWLYLCGLCGAFAPGPPGKTFFLDYFRRHPHTVRHRKILEDTKIRKRCFSSPCRRRA